MLCYVICYHCSTRPKLQSPLTNKKIAYNFTKDLADELKCMVCSDVADNPKQHEECGKLICKECIKKRGEDQPCLECGTEGPYFSDKRFKMYGSISCTPSMWLLTASAMI